MWQRLIWLSCLIVALFSILLWHTTTPRWVESGQLAVAWQDDQTWSAADVTVHWDATQEQLVIEHNQLPVWASSPEKPWLSAARASSESITRAEIAGGTLQRLVSVCEEQRWHDAEVEAEARVVLSGELVCDAVTLPMQFTVHADQPHDIGLSWSVDGPVDVTFLNFAVSGDEAFFGFGQQAEHWNRRGERLLLGQAESSAQHNAITTLPHERALTVTSELRALLPIAPDSGSIQALDLRPDDEARLETWHDGTGALALYGAESPQALLRRVSESQGRMAGLPEKLHAAAAIGTARQGDAVVELLAALEEQGTPIGSVILEHSAPDAMGTNHDLLPWRPGVFEMAQAEWPQLLSALDSSDLHLMGSTNSLIRMGDADNQTLTPLPPALVSELLPLSERSDRSRTGTLRRLNPQSEDTLTWLGEEMSQVWPADQLAGWVVDYSASGAPSTESDGGEIELARSWYQWHRAQAGADALIAAESGSMAAFDTAIGNASSALPPIVSTGRQQTSWGPQAGLKASLNALLSGGISGFTVSHSLVGGSLAADQLWLQRPRSMELFLRWLELNTFTAWLRLHEGEQPGVNYQVDDSVSGRVHFDRMARLFSALHPYRESLMVEAREEGWPLVRPLWFEYPEDPVTWGLPSDQFLLGSQVLVVPVLSAGMTEREFYLPAGDWYHLWEGQRIESDGEHLTMSAPIGEPLVLLRDDFDDLETVLATASELSIGKLFSQ